MVLDKTNKRVWKLRYCMGNEEPRVLMLRDDPLVVTWRTEVVQQQQQ
jgi:hypothetical protein